MNIMTNFVADEVTTCDDRDLFWIKFQKNLIRARDNLYKEFVSKSNTM